MASLNVIFRLALATLWENKLRSILTLIGMVFGTAAVIATLSSNDGAQKYISRQMESLGNKLVTITSTGTMFSKQDLTIIKNYADEIDLSVIEYSQPSASIRYKSSVTTSTLYSVENDYFKAMNLELSVGRNYLAAEESQAAFVAVVGNNIRRALFGRNSFVGESVLLKIGTSLVLVKIIGAFKEKGGPAGVTLDNGIFVTSKFGNKLTSQERNGRLLLLLKDDNRSKIATQQIQALLKPKFNGQLQISDAREAIERTRSIWAKQNLVGICLASVSLLTGGVGIMNIMLLSIHQRQKEIGLRKAVGAQNSEIATQFLLETVLICLAGGLVGVLVGWGFSQQVAKMLGDWEAETSLQSILLALIFSVLTGIVFGLIPAMRASRIDPYDALRTG